MSSPPTNKAMLQLDDAEEQDTGIIDDDILLAAAEETERTYARPVPQQRQRYDSSIDESLLIAAAEEAERRYAQQKTQQQQHDIISSSSTNESLILAASEETESKFVQQKHLDLLMDCSIDESILVQAVVQTEAALVVQTQQHDIISSSSTNESLILAASEESERQFIQQKQLDLLMDCSINESNLVQAVVQTETALATPPAPAAEAAAAGAAHATPAAPALPLVDSQGFLQTKTVIYQEPPANFFKKNLPQRVYKPMPVFTDSQREARAAAFAADAAAIAANRGSAARRRRPPLRKLPVAAEGPAAVPVAGPVAGPASGAVSNPWTRFLDIVGPEHLWPRFIRNAFWNGPDFDDHARLLVVTFALVNNATYEELDECLEYTLGSENYNIRNRRHFVQARYNYFFSDANEATNWARRNAAWSYCVGEGRIVTLNGDACDKHGNR